MSRLRPWALAAILTSLIAVIAPTSVYALCGDGVVEPGEGCDDGARTSDDGCDLDCVVEPGWECVGTPSTCSRTCGDGVINAGEECDDGNVVANDGCGETCLTEYCGDGLVNNIVETCDAMGEDAGCVACQIQPGFSCVETLLSGFLAPSVCVSTCGDGIKASDEECDDNNAIDGDGCNQYCVVEVCGNGIIDVGEACDDGNATGGDGCSSGCAIEAGYTCDTAGCIPITSCDPTALELRLVSTTGGTVCEGEDPFDGSVGSDWIYVYRDVPAFTISPGDTFALDALTASPVDVIASVAFAPVAVDGDKFGQPAAAFTTVVSPSISTSRGNTDRGDYDIEFTADGSYSHAGGGLLLRIRPLQGSLITLKDAGSALDDQALTTWRDGDDAYPWDSEPDPYYSVVFAIYSSPPACMKALYHVPYQQGGTCDPGSGTCLPRSKICPGVDISCANDLTGACDNCNNNDRWYYYAAPCCDGAGKTCICHQLRYNNIYCGTTPETGREACTLPYNMVKTWKTDCSSCDDGDVCTTSSCSYGTCSNSASGSGPCYTGPPATRGVGECQDGLASCPGPGTCVGEVLPATDVCDGLDNDCNGTVDDAATADASCDDADGTTVDTCVSGTCQNLPSGSCAQTDISCGPGAGPCQDCNAQDGWYVSGPGSPCCDGLQACTCFPTEQRDYFCATDTCLYTAIASSVTINDCIGCADANICTDDTCNPATGMCEYPFNTYSELCYTGPIGTEGVGPCIGGARSCAGGVMGGCSDVTPVAEVCDGVDNDCDGVVDDGAGICGVGRVCIYGGCHDACASTTDCGVGDYCYVDHNRCGPVDPCVGITCPGVKVCVEGECYDECVDDGDCTPPLLCFNGRCALSACEGIQCPAEKICHGGECYDACTAPEDCGMTATVVECQVYETCTDGTCDNYCSTDPCAGVECSAGPPARVCYLGTCQDRCVDDGDCTPPMICAFGVCIDPDNPCDEVHCPVGKICKDGECYDGCNFDAECDPANEMCYLGSCMPTDCGPDTCPSDKVCLDGVCFTSCVDDDDCEPPDFCLDNGVCAPNACAGLIEPHEYGYHRTHVFTRAGRWVTARQSTIAKLYPMPVETSDPAGWAVGTSPASAPQTARVVLLFDPTAADADNPEGRYVLWLTQGADDLAQGAGRASYSIRWLKGVDGAQLAVEAQAPDLVATGSTLGTPHFHQIQVDNAAGAANGVRLGYLPASIDATIRVDADFSGDIAAWEFYNGDSGELSTLDAQEPLIIRVQSPGDPSALVIPQLGQSCTPTGDPNAVGMCSTGTVDRCRNGELFCLASVTPWAHESCDGADNNCDGYIDEPDKMQVPAVYVRQAGNTALESWVLLATDDRASSVVDALNFAATTGDLRAGRSDYRYPDGTPLQLTDGIRALFHRDLRNGALTMPILAGADEASVAVRGLPEKVDVDVSLIFGGYGSYSEQMHPIWWDDRATVGPLKAATMPVAVEEDRFQTLSELRWAALGTTDADPALADADALLWRSAMAQGGTKGSVIFRVEIVSAFGELGIATVDGGVLPLDDAPFEVKMVAVPLAVSACYDAAETGACKYGGYACSAGAMSCQIDPDGCGCKDADGDGYEGYDPFGCPTGIDCDDTSAEAFPGGVEICDGLDNDCDGLTDATRRPTDPMASTTCPDTTPPGESCGPEECGHEPVCVCPNGPELAGDRADKCFCDVALSP